MSRQELRSTGGNCQGDDRQESCSSAGNCQADEQTVITQLSRPWSLDWACTVHVDDHTPITWLIMHWSCDWSCTEDVAIMQWSLGWTYTDHVPGHALITWLIMHWSRDWSYNDLVSVPQKPKKAHLCNSWPRGCYCITSGNYQWLSLCLSVLSLFSFSKNTVVGCHSLLQGIFPTQGLSLCLLHCRQICYHLSYLESPLFPFSNYTYMAIPWWLSQ